MFIPINIAIGLLILVLMLLAFSVVSIRQVRILYRELREVQEQLQKQSTKHEMNNQS